MLSATLQMQPNPHIYPMSAEQNNLKPLVLIVENHEDSRFMLKTLLEIWGYRTAEAEDGEESIETALSEHPNLILMDVSLSKTDGLTTMRRMREINSLGDVPIVFISGHAQQEFRASALTLGDSDFLVKPVDFNQLEIILNKFIGKNTVNANSGGFTI